MNYLTDRTQESNFLTFVFKEKQNRVYLGIVLGAAVLQFVLFKLCYPFADYFSDSYSYIYAAAIGSDVNIWPIGYSKFLALFHHISHTDTALVSFQYLFVVVTSLRFFFTILYFYSPVKRTALILYIFLFFNPLFLYLSNYISSDALFLGLSMWWLVQLLWIIHRPSPYQIIMHTLVITIAFTVRYNAIYYPFITALAYVLSKRNLWWKVVGIGLPLALIFAFVDYTKTKTYEITGTRQFSIFGGWQIANNALYMYPHITVSRAELPSETVKLDDVTKDYFNTVDPYFWNASPLDGAFYIKFQNAPLKKYMMSAWKKDTTASDVKAWGQVSPIYEKYGNYIISHHPLKFFRYYLLPNTLNYIQPPLEKLSVYNLGESEVSPIAAWWFKYKGTKVTSISKKIQKQILIILPFLFLTFNIIYLYICFESFRKRESIEGILRAGLILINVVLLLNFLFSVFASPIVFRYQVFPMILLLSFTCIQIFSSTKEMA